MHKGQLKGTPAKTTSSPVLYCVSIVVQAALFLAAAAALTLFFISFRPADFGEIFIIIGLLLTSPWFLITMLPSFFGLEDKELRREILVRQIFTVLAVVCFLIGLSVYLGFHHELWDQIVSTTLSLVEFAMDLLRTIVTFIRTIIDFLTTLFNEELLPLLTG